MDSRTYWQQRYKTETALQDHLYDSATPSMEKTWAKTAQNIKDTINRYYDTVSDSTNPYAEMRVKPPRQELKTFKTRINNTLNTTSSQAAQLADTARKLLKPTRLQALNIENTMHLYNAAQTTSSQLTKLLEQVFDLADTFNQHTSTMLGIKFNTPSTTQKNSLLKQAWLGENYSDRIWDNTSKLAATLETNMPRLFVTGIPQQDLARLISQIHNVGYKQAKRLVVTEARKINTDADQLLYTQLNAKKYTFITTRGGVCDTCNSLNNKTFNSKDMEVGVNAPPLHPNCRCTTIPAIDTKTNEKNILEAELAAVKKYGAYKMNGKLRDTATIQKEINSVQ